MDLVLPTIEAYQVQHLPIVKAYADKIGLVEAINQVVPTEMAIDPGTIVLGMILHYGLRLFCPLGCSERSHFISVESSESGCHSRLLLWVRKI